MGALLIGFLPISGLGLGYLGTGLFYLGYIVLRFRDMMPSTLVPLVFVTLSNIIKLLQSFERKKETCRERAVLFHHHVV